MPLVSCENDSKNISRVNASPCEQFETMSDSVWNSETNVVTLIEKHVKRLSNDWVGCILSDGNDQPNASVGTVGTSTGPATGTVTMWVQMVQVQVSCSTSMSVCNVHQAHFRCKVTQSRHARTHH